MQKTLSIQGMMCCHCEAHVKKALDAIAGVSVSSVSHESGTAVVSLDAPVADDVLIAAVEQAGYSVSEIL